MKIALKLIVSLIIIIALLALGIGAYISRPQTIDVEMIPSEFIYCGEKIGGSNKEYLKIAEWIHSNKDGWLQNWHTQYAGWGYAHPTFRVTVFSGFVAISYKTDWGYSQYTKSFSHRLEQSCEPNS